MRAVGRVEVAAEPLRAPPRARAAAPPRSGSATRSTWISKLRAQIVTSSPSPSPPASWNACATCDSPGPKKRSVRRSGGVPPSSTRRTSAVSSARGQSRCSSAGGPGRTTTGVPPASTTSPGAVPARPSTVEGSGTVACFVTPVARSPRTAASSARRPAARRPRSAPPAPRRPGAPRPATFATTSTVRSSWVGPRPARGGDEVGRRHRLGGPPPRARPGRRRRRGSASARARARAARAPGRGRSGRCARRGRARCP